MAKLLMTVIGKSVHGSTPGGWYQRSNLFNSLPQIHLTLLRRQGLSRSGSRKLRTRILREKLGIAYTDAK